MARIAVLIGSRNDANVVAESGMMGVFDAVGLPVPLHVISCHRNPTELEEFCRRDEVDIYIGAAGLAAALPGALAAATKMRKVVIGVPLDDYGVDTCIRLPPGVPVMTAGVGKAGLRNAAIAACQIVAVHDADVAAKLASHLDATARAPQFDIPLDAG